MVAESRYGEINKIGFKLNAAIRHVPRTGAFAKLGHRGRYQGNPMEKASPKILTVLTGNILLSTMTRAKHFVPSGVFFHLSGGETRLSSTYFSGMISPSLKADELKVNIEFPPFVFENKSSGAGKKLELMKLFIRIRQQDQLS